MSIHTNSHTYISEVICIWTPSLAALNTIFHYSVTFSFSSMQCYLYIHLQIFRLPTSIIGITSMYWKKTKQHTYSNITKQLCVPVVAFRAPMAKAATVIKRASSRCQLFAIQFGLLSPWKRRELYLCSSLVITRQRGPQEHTLWPVAKEQLWLLLMSCSENAVYKDLA